MFEIGILCEFLFFICIYIYIKNDKMCNKFKNKVSYNIEGGKGYAEY